MQAHGDVEIADVLLDQTVIAGIGNVYKSEVLFGARINPFARVAALTRDQLAEIVAVAMRFMRANVVSGFSRTSGMRRTTGRADPSARLWVYGRADSRAVAAARRFPDGSRDRSREARTGVRAASRFQGFRGFRGFRRFGFIGFRFEVHGMVRCVSAGQRLDRTEFRSEIGTRTTWCNLPATAALTVPRKLSSYDVKPS